MNGLAYLDVETLHKKLRQQFKAEFSVDSYLDLLRLFGNLYLFGLFEKPYPAKGTTIFEYACLAARVIQRVDNLMAGIENSLYDRHGLHRLFVKLIDEEGTLLSLRKQATDFRNTPICRADFEQAMALNHRNDEWTRRLCSDQVLYSLLEYQDNITYACLWQQRVYNPIKTEQDQVDADCIASLLRRLSRAHSELELEKN